MLHEFSPHEKPKQVEFIPILLGWLKILIDIWASFIYAFTRHTFGCQYFLGRAFFAVVLLGIWEACMVPYADPGLHMLAGTIFFVVAICHQIKANRPGRSLDYHSQFNGISCCSSTLRLPNGAAKMLFEPVIVFLIGMGVFQFDYSLGGFVMVGGVMCMLDEMIITDAYRTKARRMRDAEMEQAEVWAAYDRYYKK